jgi:anti-sigma regulatory factor (Ser/Thr protein kinase)
MTAPPPARHRISMPADLAGLELARLRLRDHLGAAGVEEATIAAVELVCEEAVTNCLRYGYEGTGLRWVELDVAVGDESVELTIEDDARAFDPVAAALPGLPTSIDDARVGGLGLRMMRETAARLVYERLPGRNRLQATITRRR